MTAKALYAIFLARAPTRSALIWTRYFLVPIHWQISRTFFFAGYGVESARNWEACTNTAAAIDLISGVSTAFFFILASGKVLPAHCVPCEGVLRYHFGLRIPVSDKSCDIRVLYETRTLSEGKALVFDNTFQHEVWNRTSEWRIVLFVDFLRPLPLVPLLLNNAVTELIRRTSFIRVAAKNQERWETSFYM
ncbi:aspartyl/asparaginyl beta-hydroxylase domain-containing protein [Variovorax sp. RHLX14]|uniref:aspartyl/asparaginyl beta-hydroxylase domain-containing protein n=1 Tax=Variovorax sp. RHLX14 TaxID=1259731 RepID=UPI003F489698